MHKIFKSLEGTWKIKRQLSDKGTAAGTATFAKESDDQLLYSEKVDVNFRDAADLLHTHQEYKFTYDPGTNLITKYTRSNDKMYDLQFHDKQATGTYLCIKDTYHAKYEFTSDTKFTLTYIVNGPEKDYSIVTVFEKEKDVDTSGESFDGE